MQTRLLFFLFLTCLFYACDKSDIFECWVFENSDFVFKEVTKMPEYLDGGDDGFAENAGKEVNYPPEAREKGIQGRVIAQYEITEQGRVENIEIIEDIGGGCGEEVVRVIELVTTGTSFDPAEIDGSPVRVRKELPISFKLE